MKECKKVTCPVCRGEAVANPNDRVVECLTRERIGHCLVFLSPGKFGTLFTLGYIPL